MSVRYSRISTVTALLLGVVAGWSLSLLRPTPFARRRRRSKRRDDPDNGTAHGPDRRLHQGADSTRRRLLPRLQGRPTAGLAAHLSPID